MPRPHTQRPRAYHQSLSQSKKTLKTLGNRTPQKDLQVPPCEGQGSPITSQSNTLAHNHQPAQLGKSLITPPFKYNLHIARLAHPHCLACSPTSLNLLTHITGP
jgi:hypothetical protein